MSAAGNAFLIIIFLAFILYTLDHFLGGDDK
jgi:hypothetical protein